MQKIETTQRFPINIDTAWDFFSSPHNLTQITPPDIRFTVLSPTGEIKIYPGMFIEYTTTLIAGITIPWVTEITHVSEKKYFVDEQRIGPFSIWHHQHHFETIEGGIEIKDIVHWKSPAGIFGNILNKLFINNKLHHVFRYRQEMTQKIFGTM